MSRVEVTRPPISTTAMPERISLEAPMDSARGSIPTIIVTDVMRMGRRRVMPASTSAWRSGMPRLHEACWCSR